MKIVYIIAGLAVFAKMLLLENPAPPWLSESGWTIAEAISSQSGVPNAVAGILFHHRLYDTLFEVVVFSLAALGVIHLLKGDGAVKALDTFQDDTTFVLARIGATLSAIVAIELVVRGHLSPGGGFPAGVAGGTAIALVAVTSSTDRLEQIYETWKLAFG